MTPHDALVDRCTALVMDEDIFVEADGARKCVRAVLAEVLRTIGTVTPEMVRAAEDKEFSGGYGYADECYPADVSQVWLAMLRAAPLTPSGLQPTSSNITTS